VSEPRYRNVLVIEDDETFCRVVARSLEAYGVEVRSVASVQAALGAIAERRPDLLLLDIGLPDRTGWDLLRALRAQQVEIPTVILSAARVPPERLSEFRPLAYVRKPFPLEALLRVVVGAPAADIVEGARA
jgi:two-component system KDP operon response regulator KdpE